MLSYNSDHGLIPRVLTERLADYVIRPDKMTSYEKRDRVTDQNSSHIFLSYNEANREFVESLARRLQGDARLSFWSGPWHSIPGQPLQEQMEEALWAAGACAVFIGSGRIEGWQNEQMRTAIQTRVEDLIATACQQAPRNMTRIEWQIFMRDQDHRAVCPNLPV